MPSHHRTPQPDPKYNNQQRVAYSLQHSQELTSSAVSHPQNLHAVHLPNINDHGFSGNLLNPQMRESRNPSGGDYMNSATKASLPTPKSHKSQYSYSHAHKQMKGGVPSSIALQLNQRPGQASTQQRPEASAGQSFDMRPERAESDNNNHHSVPEANSTRKRRVVQII